MRCGIWYGTLLQHWSELYFFVLQGKSQRLEANVARVLDATSKKVKNLQLKQPVRIRISKSPVLINYRLYQVGVMLSIHLC